MGARIGPLHLRRSILIQSSPERVWQEFSSFARLDAWFGRGHRLHAYAPELGATVDLSVEIEGKERHFGGAIVVWEPCRELTMENNWHDGAWPVPTFLTLRLGSVYEATLVELLHHGFERLGAEAADTLEGYEDGWSGEHLKALRTIVEGRS